MKVRIQYNDGAIERHQIPNESYKFETQSPLKAFREIVNMQGNGWEIAEAIINDPNDNDSYELEDISDAMLQEYFDKEFEGDWIKAINYWLDEVDISGDRDIFFIEVDGKVVRDCGSEYEDEDEWTDLDEDDE